MVDLGVLCISRFMHTAAPPHFMALRIITANDHPCKQQQQHQLLFPYSHLLCSPPTQIPYTQEEYEAAKARNPDLFDGKDGLLYGKTADLPTKNVDNMVNELTERCGISPGLNTLTS